MNEQRRQHYLQAFGIETYVPRRALPGAAESPMLVWDEFDDDPAAAVDTAGTADIFDTARTFVTTDTLDTHTLDITHTLDTTQTLDITDTLDTADTFDTTGKAAATNSPARPAVAPSGGAGEARLALSGELAGPAGKGRARALTEPSSQTIPKHAAAPRTFVLRAWRIRDDLMVLDSWQARLALPVDELLLNISIALGCPVRPLPRPETLRWPLLQTAAVSASPERNVEEARAMVHAYLAAQHEKHAIGTVLLMGAQAVRHGLDAGDLIPDLAGLLGQSFSIALGGEPGGGQGAEARGIVLPSLAALLQKPSLKALTWQAIKHLRVSH